MFTLTGYVPHAFLRSHPQDPWFRALDKAGADPGSFQMGRFGGGGGGAGFFFGPPPPHFFALNFFST
jgi:hypothetical protein